MKSYNDRSEYRRLVSTELISWHTAYKETELLISAEKDLSELAYSIVYKLRSFLDEYISKNKEFAESLVPIDPGVDAPQVVQDMCLAALSAGVGPMATVAGVFAKQVGERLLEHSNKVIIENGGDVWLRTGDLSTVAVYAGQSSLSMKLGITLDTYDPMAVCTSSGTVGPSLSFGKADAAVVVSYDACLADACATRLGNEIKSADDIEKALESVFEIKGVIGALAIAEEKVGAIGGLELANL